MKLGFASAILPDQNFEYVVDFASQNGYRCVEMMCWPVGKAERRYAGVTHIDADRLDASRVSEIKDYLAARNVSISALGYYPNPLDPDAEKASEAIAHIKKLIKTAPLLGVDTVNTFIGRDPKATVGESLRAFNKVWPDIIKLAEDTGVRIAIENCPMLFTSDEWPGGKNLATTPRIWREMFSAIRSKTSASTRNPSHFSGSRWHIVRSTSFARSFHIHNKDARFARTCTTKSRSRAPLDYSCQTARLGDIDWANSSPL